MVIIVLPIKKKCCLEIKYSMINICLYYKYDVMLLFSLIARFARPAKQIDSKRKEARSMVENRSNQIQYDFYL